MCQLINYCTFVLLFVLLAESKETPTQPEASADVEPVEKKEEEKEEKEEEASSPQDESQPAAVADKKEEVEVTTDTPVVEEQTVQPTSCDHHVISM